MDANTLRRSILAKRDALNEATRLAKSDAVWKRLVELEAFQTASQALFYLTHGSEVDTELMRRMTRELGMTVAAPRSFPGTKEMHFHVLGEDEDAVLTPGPYGILQPAAETPHAVLGPDTVVIVPGAVFDRQGHRLGFGSGYYDRWLAGEGKGLRRIGLAFHEQVVDHVPTQPHDMDMDYIVTDTEVVDCAARRAS